ncbi:hypothetical protein RhiirA5_378869 [Rhizophagus irregularis]|uniref:Uncharacterized protein n=2 Tax=Rhizophagus irregularis TaxID=588596 RepID=A0A2N0PE82_9GLOM|nr:hypothetical protein GLOIN_2v1845033 [Rhizophagus irregularis DAOM 181602=DAOM 197198]PKC05134.1 hypothetical protein RhiirA5_378869 [Rhizophagus irregularis]POG64911.1 hypothetical protein GLOIN_2v1845033 [Rhizophagus irregularis DAOM 181602=DAOM 197198]|eukprot:XP_025171777.1 hypothetical protein GLOIN_2v1845033 [Rhizophagus irregularis DAOM 181602=DAOM 197198]
MNPSYDQMNSPTSAAFDIFFSGIIPIGYSTFFEPLLSAPLKSKKIIIYLVIIPSNVIYVKIAFNINLILVMRFFTIFEDKPSNKKRGLACVILFAFDDIHKIERELKNEEWDQDWYTSFLSHPMINRINRMIDKIKEIIKKKKIDDDNYYYNEEEDKSNCNKANILYYYKYGESLEKRRIKKPCQKFIQDNESMISSSDNIIVIQDNENMSSSTENTIIKYNESTSSSENIITIQVHEFLLETYKSGIKLHDEIKKANKVYKLFNGIGVEKIYQVERFSVDDIERLEYKEIDEIIKNVRFCNF